MVSYKKLWKLLIDRDFKKRDLIKLTGVAPATVAKMTKGENVTTETLSKICTTLKCNIEDIIEISFDNN